MLFRFFVALLWGQAIGQTYIRKDILINDRMNWSDARRYCQQNYVDLATYKNDQEYDLLGTDGFYWFGLHLVNEIWKWTDGEEITASFQRWAMNQPDGVGLFPECANMIGGEWDDRSCSFRLPFLCFYWSHKLILVRENKTWEEALMHCRSHHTDLASLPLRSDRWQAKNLSRDTHTPIVWTSLRFLADDWLWIGMNPMEGGEYQGTELPPCPLQHCGALDWETNALTNRNCLEKFNFICYETIQTGPD